MSRVMYSYRIPKDKWWELSRDIRRTYLDKHAASVLVNVALKNRNRSPVDRFDALDKIITVVTEKELTVDLQLFDEGDTYIVRPLERGYFFMNTAQRWVDGFGLERVYYDDRSDVPTEDENNREVSVWCDKMIEDGEYLVFPVITTDLLYKIGLDAITSDQVAS